MFFLVVKLLRFSVLPPTLPVIYSKYALYLGAFSSRVWSAPGPIFHLLLISKRCSGSTFLLSPLFFLFFCQMIALQKLWKMPFDSPKKSLFPFLRYSKFCNFSPSFPHFPDSKKQTKGEWFIMLWIGLLKLTDVIFGIAIKTTLHYIIKLDQVIHHK